MSSRMTRFAITSGITVVLVFIALISFYRHVSMENLESHYESHSMILTQIFLNSLDHHGLDELLSLPSDIRFEDPYRQELLAEFDTIIAKHMNKLEVKKIKIYGTSGYVIYSNLPGLIGEDARENDAFLDGMQGKSTTELIHRDTFNTSDGVAEDLDLFENYVPILSESGDEVRGVLEIYSDVTQLLQHMAQEERRVALGIFVILAVFYVTLSFLFHEIDRTLKRKEAEREQYLEQLETAKGSLESRFRDLSETSDEYVWETDEEGFCTFATDRVASVLGYEPEELIGKRLIELVPEEDRSHLYSHLKQYELGTAFNNLEHRCRRKDGETIWQSISGLPVVDEAGKVRGYRGVGQNITQRKLSEGALRNNEESLRAIMSNVPDAIITVDAIGRIVSTNSATEYIFEYQSDELIGQSLASIIEGLHANDDGTLYESNWDHLTRAGRTEMIGIRRDEHRFPIDLWARSFELNKRNQHVVLCRDISERKEAEKKLAQSRQHQHQSDKMAAIGQLAAGILHEVGNPVAAISAAVQDLGVRNLPASCSIEECPLHNEPTTRLNLILEQTNRLEEIARDVTSLVSPQLKTIELFDLNTLIENTTKLLSYDIRWRDIDLQVDLDRDLPALMGSANDLRQVLLNLFMNSTDAFTATSVVAPFIRVNTKLEEDTIHITVSDNCGGMDQETLANARDAFFTTKGSTQGTGLGLTLSESVVQAHNGTLNLDSVLGVGTSVHIYIPVDGMQETE